MGRHHIRWALLPHKGDLGHETVRAGYGFNNPMRVLRAPQAAVEALNVLDIKLTGDPSLVLDTVKRGEDDEDVSRGELPKRKGRSVVLRIFDSLGGTSRGVIETGFKVKKAWKTNVLEDEGEEIQVEEGGIRILLRPFEVATFRLEV
jgi:alpha-mannosidase